MNRWKTLVSTFWWKSAHKSRSIECAQFDVRKQPYKAAVRVFEYAGIVSIRVYDSFKRTMHFSSDYENEHVFT